MLCMPSPCSPHGSKEGNPISHISAVSCSLEANHGPPGTFAHPALSQGMVACIPWLMATHHMSLSMNKESTVPVAGSHLAAIGEAEDKPARG